MPLFDLNKILKGAQEAAESIAKTVTDATEKLPDNVGNIVKDLSQKGQAAYETIVEKGGEVINNVTRQQADFSEKVSAALRKDEKQEKLVTFQDAFKIVYALIAVDGEIHPDEEEKLNEIGRALEPGYISCENAIGKDMDFFRSLPMEDPDELYDKIHNYVGNIILSSHDVQDGIRGKVLLWDLMTVSYSDNEKSVAERRLIRYIAETFGIEKSICIEMDQTIQTLIAVEKEIAWLKTTDRPYLEIEARINELSDRKNAIMSGVQALLAD